MYTGPFTTAQAMSAPDALMPSHEARSCDRLYAAALAPSYSDVVRATTMRQMHISLQARALTQALAARDSAKQELADAKRKFVQVARRKQTENAAKVRPVPDEPLRHPVMP